MAVTARSVRSEDAINVSQDAVSSPADHSISKNIQVNASQDIDHDAVSRKAQMDQSAEMVEDSYTRETTGGNARSAPQEDGEDELYETTPIKSLSKKPTSQVAKPQPIANNESASMTSTSYEAPMEQDNGKVLRRQPPQDAIDSLLASGANVQSIKNAEKNGPETVESKEVARGKEIAPSKKSKDSALPPVPVTSKLPQVKRSKDAQPSTVVRHPSGLPTPDISGKRHPALVNGNEQSSVAALRARRGARDGVSQPAGQASSKSDAHTGRKRVDSSTDADVMPPEEAARRDQRQRKYDESPQKNTTAVRSPSRATAEKEPANSKGKQKPAATKRTKEQASPRKKGERSGKLPNRVQPRRDAKNSDSYDIPDDSDAEDEVPPAKKPRVSKPVAPKDGKVPASRGKKPTAARPRAVQTPSVAKNPGGNLVSSARSKTSTQAKSTTANTAKARMKPMDDRLVVNDSHSPVKQSITPTGEPVGTKSEPGKNPKTTHESLEDFENQVVHYEGDDLDKDSAELRLANTANHGQHERLSRDSSQQNAIILSDNHDPPPQDFPERPQSLKSHKQPRAKDKAPETPSNFRSSPPGNDPGPGLVDPEIAKRSNIISFNKSGPRNQGTLSARRIGSPSTQTERSSLVPQNTNLPSPMKDTNARQSGHPKGAVQMPDTLSSSTRSRKVQQPKVTNDVSDALSAFLKSRPTTDIPQAELERSIPVEEVDRVGDARDRFQGGEGYMHIGDFEGTTLVANGVESDWETMEELSDPPASQQAMPPPPIKPGTALGARAKKQTHWTSGVPSMLSVDKHARVADATQTPQKANATKRTAQSPLPQDRPSKHTHGADTETRAKGKPEVVKLAKASQATLEFLPPYVRQHTAGLSPMKHQPRKASRHASRGSQSVDINGSPVGPGVVVDGTTTVLETFSQHVNLRSDPTYVETATVQKPKAPKVPNPRDDVSLPMPGLVPLRMLASNSKPRPAPPQDQSRAITAHATTEKGHLIVQDEVSVPERDPFTSSDEPQQRSSGTNSSTFLQQLRRFAEQKKKAKLTPQRRGDADPDKTLVEPTSPPPCMAKRRLSISSASSSEGTSQEEESNDAMRDIAVWRDGLLPHQSNLFDELVSVSHQIIRHLVDRETASKDLVEDYRRRGLQLVEQMELSQAAHYQKYLFGFEERKKSVHKDMKWCSQKLSDMMPDVGCTKRKGSTEATDGAVLEGMQNIIEQYC